MRARVLGWLLLLGALSVPAFLIWNWWVKQQTKSTYQVQLKAPQGGTFGEVRSQQGGLPNPIQGGTTAAAAAPADPPAGGQQTSAPQGRESAAQQSDAAQEQPPEQEPEAQQPARRRAMQDGRQAIVYNPKIARDPTLSVIDEKYLALQMEDREAARRARNQRRRPKKKPRVDVRKKLNVQGIITLPTGNSAIINDEVRARGDKIYGCVIRRITSKRVVFKCPGHRPFSKSVEQ